jgi:hypothetical protein
MGEDQPTRLEAPALEDQAESVLRRVRASFVDVLGVLGLDPESPREVARRLGLDKSLAWKIARIAHGLDLFAIGQHLPGASGAEIFLKAVRRRGAPAARVEAVRSALRDFDRLVEVHSGDRASLEIMLSSFTRESVERLEMLHRKQLFSGASYLWGVQAKTQLRADFVAPSSDGAMVDIASLRGFVGLRRLRPEVPWVIDRTRIADDDATVRQPLQRAPLDPGCDAHRVAPLLAEFCSKPLPEVRRLPGPEGFVHLELAAGPVGNTGAVTCISAEIFRGAAPRYRDTRNTRGEHAQLMRTPCKVLVFDVFLHRELAYATPPAFAVEGQVLGVPAYPPADRERTCLPVHETVEDLGAGPPIVHTPDIPDYGRIAQTVFERVGWNPEEFQGFRVRMRYPPSPTVVVLHYPLPEQPDSD